MGSHISDLSECSLQTGYVRSPHLSQVSSRDSTGPPHLSQVSSRDSTLRLGLHKKLLRGADGDIERGGSVVPPLRIMSLFVVGGASVIL